jgi:hypothetical protein
MVGCVTNIEVYDTGRGTRHATILAQLQIRSGIATAVTAKTITNAITTRHHTCSRFIGLFIYLNFFFFFHFSSTRNTRRTTDVNALPS